MLQTCTFTLFSFIFNTSICFSTDTSIVFTTSSFIVLLQHTTLTLYGLLFLLSYKSNEINETLL